MHSFWSASGAAEQAAIAAGSTWNAAYFGRRALHGARARRVAAGTLALLFAGVAVEAFASIPVVASAAEVLRRVPLLLGTLTVAVLVAWGGPPAREGGAR